MLARQPRDAGLSRPLALNNPGPCVERRPEWLPGAHSREQTISKETVRRNEQFLSALEAGDITYDEDATLRQHALQACGRWVGRYQGFGKEYRGSPKKIDAYAALIHADIARVYSRRSAPHLRSKEGRRHSTRPGFTQARGYRKSFPRCDQPRHGARLSRPIPPGRCALGKAGNQDPARAGYLQDRHELRPDLH